MTEEENFSVNANLQELYVLIFHSIAVYVWVKFFSTLLQYDLHFGLDDKKFRRLYW